MDKILFVNACPRKASRTLALAAAVLDKLEGEREEVRLFDAPPALLDEAGLAAREDAVGRGALCAPCLAPARLFAEADVIVIAAPYWDLMFPAALKLYLESVTVAGITFRYSPAGRPEGLCRARALYYVTTAGGFIGQNDFGFAYVQALAGGMLGIPDVRRFAAEGLDIDGADAEGILREAKASILLDGAPTVIPYPEKYGDAPAQDGASAFGGTLDHGHSRYYVTSDFYHMESDATLHILSRFKTYQQTTEYTCGAASALMVLNWFGKEQYHERAVAGLLETHATRGSSVESIADFFDLIGWCVDYHASPEPRFADIGEAERAIIDYIDRGIPLMVDWVDWAGHWQVLIGIDTCGTDTPYDDVLIFADPYDVTDHKQDGYYTYPLGRFFGMWREGPCAQKSAPYRHPFVAAWPKGREE